MTSSKRKRSHSPPCEYTGWLNKTVEAEEERPTDISFQTTMQYLPLPSTTNIGRVTNSWDKNVIVRDTVDAKVTENFQDYLYEKTWKRDMEVGDFKQEHEKKGNQFHDKIDEGQEL